jgi:hypothetical protein
MKQIIGAIPLAAVLLQVLYYRRVRAPISIGVPHKGSRIVKFGTISSMGKIAILAKTLAMVRKIDEHCPPVTNKVNGLLYKIVGIQNRVVIGVYHLLLAI